MEGAPAILMVPVVYFCLPNSASMAAFLTEREREITVARSVQDGNTGQGEKLNWRNVGEGLKDPKAWIQALSKFRGFVARCILLTGVPTQCTFRRTSAIRRCLFSFRRSSPRWVLLRAFLKFPTRLSSLLTTGSQDPRPRTHGPAVSRLVYRPHHLRLPK